MSEKRDKRDELRRRFREERAPRIVASAKMPWSPVSRDAVHPPISAGLAAFGSPRGSPGFAVVSWPDPDDPFTVTPAVQGLFHAKGPLALFVAKRVPESKARDPRGRLHAPARAFSYLPWIATGRVELFTFDEDDEVERCELDPKAALEGLEGGVVAGVQPIHASRAPWLALLEEAAEREGFVENSRPSYRAWHVQGRMVLQAIEEGSKLIVSAGVHYADPHKRQAATTVYELDRPISSEEVGALMATARSAAEARKRGDDKTHQEHLLQSWLAERPALIETELLQREFPAMRAGRRAYIDFLGKDRLGRLHVVETKIGTDSEIVLQALEYWAWVRANRNALARRLDADPEALPIIDLVVQRERAEDPLLDLYALAHFLAVDERIVVRLHRVEWRESNPVVHEEHTVREDRGP